MQATDTARFSWTETELYRELCAIFPEVRTQKQNVLDVEVLADRLTMTKEGLYKWLRAGRILSKQGAERIFKLATSVENSEALARHGRTPPSKQDIARFLLS